jgi:ankyrin repeat protein
VFCQLVYLRRCIPARIRRALNELPETLDETYARTLEDIDEQNWEYAHRLFQCVAAASRPLLVNELADILAFDFEAGPTPTFLASWRPEDPEHSVLSVCSSLLAVVKPRRGSPVVQFAHFSVKEYLTSARLAKAKDAISRFQVSMTAAHTIVARACLGVLLHLDENITRRRLEKFPLAKYAAEHWVGHARFESVSSSVQDGMKRLFDPTSRSHLSVWIWICDPDYSWDRSGLTKRPEKARATPLHYATFFGLHNIATFLIVEHSQDVNARSLHKDETPLHVASRGGHADIAKLLLEHGADVEVQDDLKCTPLRLASQAGHVEVARVLLEYGADIEGHGKDDSSPLGVASLCGHVEVARVLLEHGADVDSRSWLNRTALHWVEKGEVALLLLDHGADASALDDLGQTPLHKASENGHVGVTRVLLEHGVDVNARDANNMTPLHAASCHIYSDRGHAEVVRLLLQHNADIHARDDRGRTPFRRAVKEGHHDIMQLLLEHGAEDHRTDNSGQTRGLYGDR